MDCPILKENEKLEARRKADEAIIKELRDSLRQMLKDVRE